MRQITAADILELMVRCVTQFLRGAWKLQGKEKDIIDKK